MRNMAPIKCAAIIVCTWLVTSVAGAQQSGDWIFDVFVQKCRESGGSPGTTLQEYRRGEKFQCRSGGGSGASKPEPCEIDAKRNVDWVFENTGARGTYTDARKQGKSAFDSVIYAQRHNVAVQDKLRLCRDWVVSYLASRGQSGTQPGAPPSLGNRKLGVADCECISVLPLATGFRVTSRCAALKVSVLFVDAFQTHGVHTEAPGWAQAGIVGGGREGAVRPPRTYKVPSIKAVALANDDNHWTCEF